jgi:hypothetical protein
VDIAGESHVWGARASACRTSRCIAIHIVVLATHPTGNNRPSLKNALTGFNDDPQDATTHSTHCGIFDTQQSRKQPKTLNRLWETRRRRMKDQL